MLNETFSVIFKHCAFARAYCLKSLKLFFIIFPMTQTSDKNSVWVDVDIRFLTTSELETELASLSKSARRSSRFLWASKISSNLRISVRWFRFRFWLLTSWLYKLIMGFRIVIIKCPIAKVKVIQMSIVKVLKPKNVINFPMKIIKAKIELMIIVRFGTLAWISALQHSVWKLLQIVSFFSIFEFSRQN